MGLGGATKRSLRGGRPLGARRRCRSCPQAPRPARQRRLRRLPDLARSARAHPQPPDPIPAPVHTRGLTWHPADTNRLPAGAVLLGKDAAAAVGDQEGAHLIRTSGRRGQVAGPRPETAQQLLCQMIIEYRHAIARCRAAPAACQWGTVTTADCSIQSQGIYVNTSVPGALRQGFGCLRLICATTKAAVSDLPVTVWLRARRVRIASTAFAVSFPSPGLAFVLLRSTDDRI